ncbi:MAG: hypothetical protein E5X40_14400 [Mesorhizobium sp.]|uniref:hypothetical protein n=1 Tax=Mesorhizobium sp. TaxID=1871066 RepID=UPI000FE8199D|nr:hypothetical protein [Mesorhizobium sp.]RWG39431.1 MAG: hypothetical protein EOQ62_31430 [Mesorhizobium sp.]RWJ33211.1 MAG: hypothetical protein EOR28_11540 [Mesorhizobium sp.]TIQ64417.1 MAG: hypothetical protein E5X41_17300 [Mesorhizobium sp.]TIQ71850.1 MAG: hypothetical protein E5X40_14400 [Mesorhizobium sp.]
MGALLGIAFSPIGRAVGVVLLAAALVGGIYVKGRADGRASVLSKLADDRVTILKDGKKIDEQVLAADDDALCALLGGCV